jgi:thiol-disulfide isomerase/thioredoxin
MRNDFYCLGQVVTPSLTFRSLSVVLTVLVSACQAKPAETPARDSVAPVANTPGAVGSVAPSFAVPVIDADTARLGGAARQPLTLVNIWATWCGPCKAEFPELQRLHTTYAPRGLRLLAVSIDETDDDATVAASAKAMGVTFPIGRDPKDEVRGRFGAIGIPESWLISTDGKILWRHAGAIVAGDTSVRRAIEVALGTGGPTD